MVKQGQAANPASQACATSRAEQRAAVLSRLWPSLAARSQSQPCTKPNLWKTVRLTSFSQNLPRGTVLVSSMPQRLNGYELLLLKSWHFGMAIGNKCMDLLFLNIMLFAWTVPWTRPAASLLTAWHRGGKICGLMTYSLVPNQHN